MCSYQSIHEWQTRLVLIKPNANSSASLELSLIVVDLVDLNTGAVINHDTTVTYDALSYAWGTASPSIECVCDGNMILLRDNLDSALRYLRQSEDERYVWIDFLCINQDDLAEKAVQIPRMKNIYSKASTVVIWLGESLEIENITRLCGKNCGPDLDFLGCSIHKKQLWKPIMEYAWFKRTWVRQEVWAAERLEVSCPYFSMTWELFAKKLLSMHRPNIISNTEAVDNLISLNELHSSWRLELLALLKQGKGFQASVPHDHIFSVLGMMSMPKHSTKASIPVSYDKTYHEVCGDVTRYIIRESHSISILQLCTVQRDRTYAFDWPTVKWSYPISDLMQPQDGFDVTSESIEQFEKENPMRISGTPDQSKNTASSIPSQLALRRPLILYGRAWGTVTEQWNNALIGRKPLPTYLVDQKTWLDLEAIGTQHVTNHSQPPQLAATPTGRLSRLKHFASRYLADHTTDGGPDEYREFALYKNGLICTVSKGKIKEYNARVYWEGRGCVGKGDVFVALEPGPWNVLLRRCSGFGNYFEVVGWGGQMKKEPDIAFEGSLPDLVQNGDRSKYYLAEEELRPDSGWTLRENHAPGPRQTFKIR